MSRPRRVTDAQERIDQPADDVELARSLNHVASVNRWLGGTRALLRALEPLVPTGPLVSILDVGTGAADIPRALAAWAAKRGMRMRLIMTDRHPQTIALAARRTRAHRSIVAVRGDALTLPFADRSFDLALLSLTLHHLGDDAQADALRELARVARTAIIVNELERSWPNYFGAKLLAQTIWRRNELTRHDAPLSVLRAFAPDELLARGRAAGLRDPRVERRFFYRLVLVGGVA